MYSKDFNPFLNFIKGSISILKAIFTVFCRCFKRKIKRKAVLNTLQSSYSGNFPECNHEKCTGCGICTKVCPIPQALTIKSSKKDGKKLALIDFSRCISCGSCAYNCPNNAINLTKQYELATNNKKDLILNCKKVFKEKMQKQAQNSTMPEFVSEEEI